MSVWLTPDLKPFYGGTYYPGVDSWVSMQHLSSPTNLSFRCETGTHFYPYHMLGREGAVCPQHKMSCIAKLNILCVGLVPHSYPTHCKPCAAAGKDQYGMPSFMTVLKRIAQLWDTKRSDLQEQVCIAQAGRNAGMLTTMLW